MQLPCYWSEPAIGCRPISLNHAVSVGPGKPRSFHGPFDADVAPNARDSPRFVGI